MHPLFETVTDLSVQADVIRRRRYGVIEVVGGQLVRVRFRPFPTVATLADVWLGRWRHQRQQGDTCLVYFNQPRVCSNFLSVVYVVSTRQSCYATIRRAAAVLDEIARCKGTDALLCDAANPRISERLLRRWGWQPHAPHPWHRNFIKRLYPDAARG